MENERSFEELVKAVTREVLRELGQRKEIPLRPGCRDSDAGGLLAADGSARMDLSAYKTPLVTENGVRRLHELTRSIMVPPAALFTPRAKELLREKNIQVIYDNK
jgi:hypothetical protein